MRERTCLLAIALCFAVSGSVLAGAQLEMTEPTLTISWEEQTIIC